MSTLPTNGTNEELHELIEDRLRHSDQRYTSGRRTIIDLLISAGHPVSIEDIARERPELPRSSAYRSLVDLETAGLVRRVVAHDDFARFELAEDLTEHHHHLLCVECGKVIDFAFTEDTEDAMAKAIKKVASAENFQPQGHRIDVLGVCAACR